MLPITNHKGLRIPHSLATAAAIVALAIALGWDASGDDGARPVGVGGALDQMVSVASQDAGSSGESALSAQSGGLDCEPGSLSCLLPLVLPKVSGF